MKIASNPHDQMASEEKKLLKIFNNEAKILESATCTSMNLLIPHSNMILTWHFMVLVLQETVLSKQNFGQIIYRYAVLYKVLATLSFLPTLIYQEVYKQAKRKR